MTWETTNVNKRVVVHRNGENIEYEYAATTLLKDAVTETARACGLSTVIVKCDGNEVQPDAGNREIGSFTNVELFPKIAGA